MTHTLENGPQGEELDDEPTPLETFYDQANAYLNSGILEHAKVPAHELEKQFDALSRYVEMFGEELGDFQLVLPDAVVPLQRQLEAAGGYGFVDFADLQDTAELPQVPYLLVDLDIGLEDRGKFSVAEARETFSEDGSTGLTIGEVVSVAVTDVDLWGRAFDKADEKFMGMIATETYKNNLGNDTFLNVYRIGDGLFMGDGVQADEGINARWVIPSAVDRIPSVDPADS